MNSYQMVLHRPVETALVLSKFALHVSGPGELGENSAFREGQLLSRITGFWGGKLEESDGIRWVPV
jgi:hypothetical protein